MNVVARFAVALLAAAPAWGSDAQEIGVHVDCRAASGGDGSGRRPFWRISDALPAAKALSATAAVTIQIAPGVCAKEKLPLLLDFPVRVHGSRVKGGGRDTLVTWTPSGNTSNAVFFQITGPDVALSSLSIDGKNPAPRDVPNVPPVGPTGVFADRAERFSISRLHLTGTRVAIRSEASSGSVRDNDIDNTSNGVFVSGGSALAPPEVSVRHNRIDYYGNAIPVAGAGASGLAVRVVIADNVLTTSYANSGPTNPAAIRFSPMVAAAIGPAGRVEAIVERNVVRGPARYGVMVHGGQPTRRADGKPYTGVVDAEYRDNDIGHQVLHRAMITFTNARATVLPCELNPSLPRSACPTLMLTGGVPTYWEYLEQSEYRLRHSGELDGALIDHRAAAPGDGRELDNRLVVNGVEAGEQTFFDVP